MNEYRERIYIGPANARRLEFGSGGVTDGRPSWCPRGRPPVSGDARTRWISRQPPEAKRRAAAMSARRTTTTRPATRAPSAPCWTGYVCRWNTDSELIKDGLGNWFVERIRPRAVKWGKFTVYASHSGTDPLARSQHGECHLEADDTGLLLTIRPRLEVEARLRALDRQARHTPLGGIGLSAEWDNIERTCNNGLPYRSTVHAVRLLGVAIVANGQPSHPGTRLHGLEERDYRRLQKLRAACAWR